MRVSQPGLRSVKDRDLDVAAAGAVQEMDGVDLDASTSDPPRKTREEVAIRDARALRLRLAGAEYADIAARLGYSSSRNAYISV